MFSECNLVYLSMQEMQIKAEYFQRKNSSLVFIAENKELIYLKLPYNSVKINLNKGEIYMLENINGTYTINKWIE